MSKKKRPRDMMLDIIGYKGTTLYFKVEGKDDIYTLPDCNIKKVNDYLAWKGKQLVKELDI